MEQINLFMFMILIHLIFYILKVNKYALLVSFLTLLIQNFVVMYYSAEFSFFSLFVVIILGLLTFENVIEKGRK